MDQAASTPANRKRSLTEADVEPVPTPASLKRQRLEDAGAGADAGAASPSTPSALTAIASAISGVFGIGRQQQKPAAVGNEAATLPSQRPNAPPPAPLFAKARPAIKLAALRGTKWDKGDIVAPKLPRRPSTTPKRPSGQPRGRGVDGELDSPSKPQADGVGTGDDRLAAREAATVDPTPNTPTKGGKAARKGPSASAGKPPAPKGILTPTKRRGRPPKSVTFNRGLDGEVHFEPLAKTPTGRKGRAPRARKVDEDEDDDEIRCAICSKPDSKAPNEIILCDLCDFAVHQECYDVPEIPTGDWLCKSCAQEDVIKTPSKAVDAADAAATPVAEIPEIANLDRHLRSFQRVLLDRCLGRRRIRMFGQEETYDKVRQLVGQTVIAGEGNSMLLIGSRGCGKTTVSGGA
ncbi:hypothetical protein DCS_00358 [Drechmeria coniospora]|uniref:PHD-type domain-containing protein n=1 Tax=Drechmeria coniospora TaxID=98403 RepID=A0A151GQ88_DRECN|nr:hypothetical protein DCS_00358 [Drechmeria coniospora]KYK59228.1 hypothetical protein DCS_00358 [Drechmeria coniospora]